MKCRIRCQILFGLVALLQFGCVFGKQPEKDHALMLQTKVENLIEKILQVIEDYYHQIRTELKCIPDEVPDTIIGTLKKAIDCVDQNERNYDNGHITANAHKKAFLKCFSDAKTLVEETITSIDPSLDYCPENMTEKTYQINVTTTFTKTFHINIKNGLEITRKKVPLGNGEQICVFNQGEHLSAKTNQTAHDNEPNNDFTDEDNSGAHENNVQDPYPKEHHGTGPESKEHPDKDHKSKEHHGEGHGSKEGHENGHESKEHHGKDHQSKENHTQGHGSKEHPGKGVQPEEHHAERPLGISDLGDEYGGNDSSTEDDVLYEAGQEFEDDDDNGKSDGDLDNPLEELPGYGGASNDDEDENENEFSSADEYEEESDFSGTDEDENEDVNRPDSAQDDDEEPEAVGHQPGRPGKGHESKVSYDKGHSSAQQPEDYEGSEVNDDDKMYEDDDAYDADNDADDDEDINFLEEGKQNIIDSISDLAAHDMEIKNKTKDKKAFSGHGPIIDDGGNDDLGTDREKFFFPDTAAKSKLTTRPGTKLAMEPPAKKPFDQDYYADPDTEPEDSNYGNEYYDASEKETNLAHNPHKPLNQKLAQSKPAAPVAQRIQIKPKNQIKHKPKKPPQNSQRHKITLPKTWPHKPQPPLASQSITSLSQSFLQSDF